MTYGEKYSFQGIQYETGKPLLVKFKKSGYSGPSTEIEAGGQPIDIDYDNLSGDKLKSIIGSRCTFQVFANETFSTLEFYSDDEITWLAEVWIDNALFWQGFVNPGSCRDDFTTDGERYASIEAVDGLALLSGFAFVQNSGNFFIGKMTPRQIIYNCLKRVYRDGVELHVHSQLYETDMDSLLNPLDQCLFNLERYLNGSTPMKALDVLMSVLSNFGMQIRQVDGVFKAYRVIDLVGTGTRKFFRYNADGTANGSVNATTYSNEVGYGAIQFEGAETGRTPDRPYRDVKVRYEYGYVTGIVENPNLISSDGTTIPGWDLTGATSKTLNTNGGIALSGDGVSPDNNKIVTDPMPVASGNKLKFGFSFRNSGYALDSRFRVMVTDGTLTYYLGQDGAWDASASDVIGWENFEPNPEAISDPTQPTDRAKSGDVSYTIDSESMPISGNLFIYAYEPTVNASAPYNFGNAVYLNISAEPIIDNAATGEYYIANNPKNYQTEPETVNVFNADDTSAIYLGTIYKLDGITPTSTWSTPLITNKPLLSIIAEERLRMYHTAFGIIEGEVDATLSPLFTCSIYNDSKYYLAVGMQYDVMRNRTRVVFVELSNSAITDFAGVKIENDYGQYQSSGSGSSGGGISTGGGTPADYLTESEAVELFYPKTGNPNGYLTGITGAQVTGALGYTPANSSHTHATLEGEYISGGAELPTYFGPGRLKLQMLNIGGHWADTLWMSGYYGTDVKLSNQLVFWKTGGARAGFRQQNYDSSTWGTLYEFYHTGNFDPANYLLLTGGSLTGPLIGILATFDNAKIGAWGANSSYARFGHKDFDGVGNYGFLQKSDGTTYIKGSGVYINDGVLFADGMNLGVGTVTPAKKLDVNGEAIIRSGLFIPAKNSGGAPTGNHYEIYVEEE